MSTTQRVASRRCCAENRADLAKQASFVYEPRKLPVVLSPEEVARMLEAAPGIKYKAALSAAYGAGLRVSEVVSLKVSDVDSNRVPGATLKAAGIGPRAPTGRRRSQARRTRAPR